MRSTIAAGLVLLAASGCAAVESLLDPAAHVDLEIRIDTLTVRAPDGYVRGFGVGAPEFDGRQMHLIEVASAQDSGISELGPAPADLPLCDGHAEAQPGS